MNFFKDGISNLTKKFIKKLKDMTKAMNQQENIYFKYYNRLQGIGKDNRTASINQQNQNQDQLKIKKVGGAKSIKYSLGVAKKVGIKNMAKTLFSKNTCKTCAFGMGGQKGGMRNELGQFPQVCKKAVQAQLTDIQQPILNNFFINHSFKQLKNMSAQELEHMGRLVIPVIKRQNMENYQHISYDDAINEISQKIKITNPNKIFIYSSGRSSNEATFVLQFLSRLLGISNITNCSYLCHSASAVGLNSTLGTQYSTVEFYDLSHADLIFVFGANPSSNHPRFMTSLINCRKRGGSVIIVNPIREPGLEKFFLPQKLIQSYLNENENTIVADEYIQLNINSDMLFLQGIAKHVLLYQKQDKDFIKNHTNNFEEYKRHIEELSWLDITKITGISKQIIQQVGNLYVKSKNTIFTWCMGITHHLNGSQTVEEIANLALLRGMVGKVGAGCLPLRGHSNIQGVQSMGMQPEIQGHLLEKMDDLINQLNKNISPKDTESQISIQKQIPCIQKGKNILECVQDALEGKIELAVILGGNIYSVLPNSTQVEKALQNIPYKVFLNTTLNHSHFYSLKENNSEGMTDNWNILIPVRTRDEELQATTQESMFNYVRMSDGGINRFPTESELKSEVEIISHIGSNLIDPKYFNFQQFFNHELIRKQISDFIEGYEQLKYIDQTKQEFQIPGRTLHEPNFKTEDQRATFIINTFNQQIKQVSQFNLMSIRSEGQFNSVIYEDYDEHRNIQGRNVILMNIQDMIALNLKQNDFVTVISKTSYLQNIKVSSFDIKQGNCAMYFPEANNLISFDTDSRSYTPAYNNTLINIQKQENQLFQEEEDVRARVQ